MNTWWTNIHAQQMLHYSLYMKSNQVTIIIPWTLAITPINSASLTAENVTQNSHTSLHTWAIVLKCEQMIIIISINKFFPHSSNEVQLNESSLASQPFLGYEKKTFGNLSHVFLDLWKIIRLCVSYKKMACVLCECAVYSSQRRKLQAQFTRNVLF